MKVFIDIGHPAHVHYFRNFISIMESKGHVIFVSARNRSIIHYLLEKFSIKYYDRGTGSNSMIGKLLYLLIADLRLLLKAIQFKPDLFLSFGTPYAAHVSYILRKPHIALTDTEHAKYGILSILRFTNTFLVPSCYYNELGSKQIKFEGFMELCYLHPQFYLPGEDIFELLGISKKEKFVLLRFITWYANHDIGQSGLDLTTKQKLIALFENKGYKVFISDESEKKDPTFQKYMIKIPPERIHDVIKNAEIFVAESGTMASEAAILGTPVVYVNSLPLMGYLKEEKDRGLLFHLSSSEGVIKKVEELLAVKNFKQGFINKSQEMLKQKINVTSFLVWFIENYPQSIDIMKENPEFQMKFK